jgi:hypothetical protein
MLTPRQFKASLAGASSIYLSLLALCSSQVGANPLDLERSSPTRSPQSTRLKRVYVPPVQAAPRTTQGSSGSRGCERSMPASLRLLVPDNHVGQTMQGHPTFFWFVSGGVNLPMEFAIVEPKVAQPIYVSQKFASRTEVMKVTLPSHLPQLEPGKTYRWSVSLICNPNQRSSTIYAQSWIERSLPSSDLVKKLASAQTDYERTITYAQSGFWYDALASISTARAAKPQDSEILTMHRMLLEQVGLSLIADYPAEM